MLFPVGRGLSAGHCNVSVALQNDMGLSCGIDSGIHLLRQQYIVGASGDDPVGQAPVELAVAKHIRQVRDDAYAPAALFPGGQLGKQSGGAVQAVYKDNAVRPCQLADRGVNLPGPGEDLADRVSVGHCVLIAGPAFFLRR